MRSPWTVIRALEQQVTDLTTRNAELEAKVPAVLEVCEHLQHAAGMVDGAQVLALQGDVAKQREQIARQEAALRAYEREHQELLGEIRRLAVEKDEAIGTVERLSREGSWAPSAVAS